MFCCCVLDRTQNQRTSPQQSSICQDCAAACTQMYIHVVTVYRCTKNLFTHCTSKPTNPLLIALQPVYCTQLVFALNQKNVNNFSPEGYTRYIMQLDAHTQRHTTTTKRLFGPHDRSNGDLSTMLKMQYNVLSWQKWYISSKICYDMYTYTQSCIHVYVIFSFCVTRCR